MNRPPQNLTRTAWLALALLVHADGIQAEPAPASGDDHGKIVQMEPYKITASFDIRGKYKKGTKIIDYAKITWAAPGFIKAGAKKGDYLISIDGKPVSGMSGEELTALMDIVLEPGVRRTFIFKGKRGLLGQTEWTTTAEYVGNQPKAAAVAPPMAAKPASVQTDSAAPASAKP